jgi:hypothetical protein
MENCLCFDRSGLSWSLPWNSEWPLGSGVWCLLMVLVIERQRQQGRFCDDGMTVLSVFWLGERLFYMNLRM